MRRATRAAPLLVVLCALTSATSARAQSTGRTPEKITGYAGYQFGMTLEQAKVVDSQAKIVDCDYANDVSICIEKQASFFGETGRIHVLFSRTTKQVIQINVAFEHLQASEGACQRAVKTVVEALFARFDRPTKMADGGLQWYAPSGGAVSFSNLCLGPDTGVVIVSYQPSAGF